MKRVFLFSVLFFALLSVKTFAEESYLVWLDDSVQLFSERNETSGAGFYTVDEETLAECLEAGIVEKYIPNATVRLCDMGWNQLSIGADFPQRVGCRGNDVTVAVIDSGIQEIGILEGRVLEGKNYLDEQDPTNVTDTVGHGTFVSGIIAAGADKCKILPLKCFDSDKGTLGHILDAIYDAVVTYEADVINLSITLLESNYTPEQLTELHDILELYVGNASTLGSLVIAAAGNEGTSAISYPAGCSDAIGVGAVDAENKHCYFSQYNESVFVVAPGMGVVSTAIAGYTQNTGTSFAAPHVTALAAIAKSMNPDLTTEEFKMLLQTTATDLGDEGRDDYYGYGLINCEAAVKALMGSQTVYISPVDQSENSIVAVFYNHSEDEVTVSCIFARRSAGTSLLATPLVQTKTLSPGQSFDFEAEKGSGEICFMAWNSLSGLKPLGNCRIK